MKKTIFIFILALLSLFIFSGCQQKTELKNPTEENLIEETLETTETEYRYEFFEKLDTGYLIENVLLGDSKTQLVKFQGEPDIADFYLGDYYSYDENNDVFWFNDQDNIVLFGSHQYQMISNGMSEEEVVQLIGEPSSKFYYDPSSGSEEPSDYDESLLGYNVDILQYQGTKYTAIIEMNESKKVNVIWVTDQPEKLIIH